MIYFFEHQITSWCNILYDLLHTMLKKIENHSIWSYSNHHSDILYDVIHTMLQSISVEVKRALSSNKMSSPQAAEIPRRSVEIPGDGLVGNPMKIRWKSYENPMEIWKWWKSYENPMKILWKYWKWTIFKVAPRIFRTPRWRIHQVSVASHAGSF